MNSQEKAAGREPGGSEKTNGALIIPLPMRRRNCTSCGILFFPRASWHRLCGQCYGWIVAGQHIAAAAKALR